MRKLFTSYSELRFVHKIRVEREHVFEGTYLPCTALTAHVCAVLSQPCSSSLPWNGGTARASSPRTQQRFCSEPVVPAGECLISCHPSEGLGGMGRPRMASAQGQAAVGQPHRHPNPIHMALRPSYTPGGAQPSAPIPCLSPPVFPSPSAGPKRWQERVPNT